MIPLLLAPLLATLAQNGLGMLASAITAKGKEVIEETLGVSLDTSVQTQEGLLQLKTLELKHEEFLVEAAQKSAELSLQEKELDVTNTEGARVANAKIQESANATQLAKDTPYILDFIIVIGTMVLAYFIFFIGIPVGNKEIAFAAFGSLLTMCGTILNFHRGTSQGSKDSSAFIKKMTGELK
jgi:hypothetical protein